MVSHVGDSSGHAVDTNGVNIISMVFTFQCAMLTTSEASSFGDATLQCRHAALTRAHGSTLKKPSFCPAGCLHAFAEAESMAFGVGEARHNDPDPL